MRITKDSVLTYDQKSILLDGKRVYPMMGEAHYSRMPREAWKDELLKMKAGGIDWVSTYVIWVHHEEVRGRYEWKGNRDLREFVRLIGECGMYCILRIGPWSHAEVRRGGFPDWLAEEAQEQGYELRSNDAPYLAHAAEFYERIAGQVRDLLIGNDGPIVGIQIENEFGHAGGLGGEEGEKHMRTLRAMARAAGLIVPVYTATGWGGAVTGGMLPVMGGYCEAPWERYTKELPPNVNYLFTEERNDHNIASDYGVRRGLTFDTAKFPYLTAELGGGMQVTAHRRPEVHADDVVAMSLAKLGSGANLLGYYMYHGGTNPKGHLTSLQECVEIDHTSDLPECSYDFQAPIREFGQLNESWRGIRALGYFVHDYEELLCDTSFIPQGDTPDSADLTTLRTAVRATDSGKSGFFFVNNYMRHYRMADHPNAHLSAKAADGSVLADFGTRSVSNGEYFFWPFGVRLGEGILKQMRATPLMVLRGKEPVYIFYGDEDPQAVWDGPEAKTLLLSREEAMRACKLGEDRILISDEDSDFVADTDGSVTCYTGKNRSDSFSFRVYPDLEKTPGGFARKGADARGLVLYESTGVSENKSKTEWRPISESDGTGDAVYELSFGNLKSSDEVYATIEYAGFSAELWCDGNKIADDFFTEGSWQVGIRQLAGPDAQNWKAELHIHPLHADDDIYLSRWPELKNGWIASLEQIRTEALYAVRMKLR